MLRSGTLGKLEMAGDEIGVQVGLDDVFDLPPVAGRRLEVDIDIPLGIDDRRNAFRPHRIGCVRQASQIESLNPYRFHSGSFRQ